MHWGFGIESDGLSIVWNKCDWLRLGTIHRGLDRYEPAGEYRRDCDGWS